MRMLQKDLRYFSSYIPGFDYFFSSSLLNPPRKNALAISSPFVQSIRDRQKCRSEFLHIITPAASSSLTSGVHISQTHLLESHRRFSTTPCLHHSNSLQHDVFSTLSDKSIEKGGTETKKWERAEENFPRVSAKGGAHHPLSSTFRTLRLHNLPKNWLHEDIIQFIEQVASHAGIPALPPSAPPSPSSSSESSPHTTSPFVHHLTIFFGRRTGIVFGAPKIVLTSSPLCDVLLQGIPFEEDDYRSRIYFTEEAASPSTTSPFSSSADAPTSRLSASASLPSSSSLQGIKETLEEAQQVALEQLELDRFLFAPDLLYDIARLHQRRLVTRSESVLLRSFRDAANDEEEDENEDEEVKEDFEGMGNHNRNEQEHLGFTDEDAADDTLPSQRFGIVRKSKVKNKHRQKKKQKKSSLAGDQSDLGRGSMHNTPIPKPYVEGRRV